jgi:hypothetical protein
MTDEKTGTPVKAVRLENFAQPGWQREINQAIFWRYPAACINARSPYVVIVELRTSRAWSRDDEIFFGEMKRQGFFQRWETLTELPPVPKHNKAVYEDIGYRIGAGERLTLKQQEALLSQLHDLQERALHAEKCAEEWQERVERADTFAAEIAATYNSLIEMLAQTLGVEIYQRDANQWTAEDQESGEILAHDGTLPGIYRKVLRKRLERTEHDLDH